MSRLHMLSRRLLSDGGGGQGKEILLESEL
jgi:hypothetical protein